MKTKQENQHRLCAFLSVFLLFFITPSVQAIADWTLGDIDSNGTVNAVDANIIRRYAARLTTVSPEQITTGDVNGDGKLNVIDANYIRRLAARQIAGFPTCTVKFLGYDGTLLKIQKLSIGDSATAPDPPTREGYVFTGWDRAFTSVAESISVTALYELAPLDYVVTFRDYDGSVLAIRSVVIGGTAPLPPTPQRNGYYFAGWSGSNDNVTSDRDITATYVPADSPNIFSLDSCTVSVGDTFTIALTMQGTVKIAGFDMNLLYDSNVLEFVSIDKEFSYDIIANTSNAGTITFNWGSAANKTSAGKTLFEVTFRVASTTASTDTVISLSTTEAVAVPDGGGTAVGTDVTLTVGTVIIQ